MSAPRTDAPAAAPRAEAPASAHAEPGAAPTKSGAEAPEEPTAEALAIYLRPTTYLDFETPLVRDFAREATEGATSARDKAVRLFYAVRDGIRYDPYTFRLTPELYVASHTLREGRGFCMNKAVLLAATCRAVGVPARLGFADVRNHLATERLRAAMGTDLFVFHGYDELWVDGAWRKATPTFNRELCQRFGVRPLDFDGHADSLLHPYDQQGARHMEYVRQRGTFADFPFDAMVAASIEAYPQLLGAADLGACAPAVATARAAVRGDPTAAADLDFAAEAKPVE